MLESDYHVMAATPGPLILLVDDFVDARELYAEYLGACGYRVEEACDGHQALEKAFAIRPDVIVMDLTLPGIDGWTVIDRLKSDPRTAAIPVLAVSGHSREEHRRRDDPPERWDGYLTKPCPPDDLVLSIQKLLAR